VRRRVTIALVTLTALVAGCGSGAKKDATVTVPAVPWVGKTPAQVAARTPVATWCRAANLKAPAQVQFVPRLQGGIALVAIRNTGTRACRLTGRPVVTFVKKGGPVQVERAIPTTPSEFPEVTYPQSALLALRPGESGDVTISWDNWCDPVIPGEPHVPPSAIRITLPGGRGDVDTNYNAVPACIDPNAPTTIGVSTFQPNLVPQGRAWSEAYLTASVPGQPVRAHRGGMLHYRVVLRNRSKTAARFAHCPAYAQQLVPNGKVEVYELNCGTARELGPGKSLAFAMQVRVPQGSPVGPNGLFWELDPFGGRTPQVHARVTIDR
jgi:hypothetical protein